MSTYSCLYFHLVFGTKHREPTIDASWRSRLHDYLGGTARGLEATPLGIGGTADHVHLLLRLKPVHRLSDLMREIKKTSSLWIHETVPLPSFAWQDGYGAFSVAASDTESVRAYIGNQEKHHRTKTFREEFEMFLKKAGIEYDPKYLP
jgi:REP element-mobilizing transposase RayT